TSVRISVCSSSPAAGNEQEQPQQAPTAPSTPSSSATTPTATEDEVISNWKLFNDLENREEAEVLELSTFLDALSKYMPGVGEEEKRKMSLSKTISEHGVGQIDIADMYQTTAHLGKNITVESVEELIQSCKKGLKIPKQTVVRVLTEVIHLCVKLPTLTEVTIAPAEHITVVGDLHGQLDDLLLIFRENGYPSEKNPYVFNGDFVDRGDRGVEIAIIIYLFKLLYPNHVYINRGNHEDFSITQIFGFMKEVQTKYDYFVYELFCESFKWLPLATVLDKRVLVVHGGVPRENKTLLREFNTLPREEYDLSRYREKPRFRADQEPYRKMTMMRDLLWSDPKTTSGWEENKRGAGINYGPNIVQKFMTKNKLALIIRSHECVPRGFDWPYEDKGMLVTLFSASNYCGKANNLGCFMRIPADKQAMPAFFQYMARVESRDLGVSNLDALFSLLVENQEALLKNFQAADGSKTGKLTVTSWSFVMEEVLQLSLDWKTLQPLLTGLDKEGLVPYKEFLGRYTAEGVKSGVTADEVRDRRRQAFNSLYRHRARLEALFRVLDRDGNGMLTLDELESGIQLLNQHLPPGTQAFTTSATEFMRMLDFSQDNQININEFMEGFRINAKLTVHAKWKRARKKIKALSALGALRFATSQVEDDMPDTSSAEDVSVTIDSKAPTEVEDLPEPVSSPVEKTSTGSMRKPLLTRHGSIQLVGPAAEVDDIASQVEKVNLDHESRGSNSIPEDDESDDDDNDNNEEVVDEVRTEDVDLSVHPPSSTA
ncbi:TPA: hypothetical protein N0F65_009735, partial [Lagenidium giganteum]